MINTKSYVSELTKQVAPFIKPIAKKNMSEKQSVQGTERGVVSKVSKELLLNPFKRPENAFAPCFSFNPDELTEESRIILSYMDKNGKPIREYTTVGEVYKHIQGLQNPGKGNNVYITPLINGSILG